MRRLRVCAVTKQLWTINSLCRLPMPQHTVAQPSRTTHLDQYFGTKRGPLGDWIGRRMGPSLLCSLPTGDWRDSAPAAPPAEGPSPPESVSPALSTPPLGCVADSTASSNRVPPQMGAETLSEASSSPTEGRAEALSGGALPARAAARSAAAARTPFRTASCEERPSLEAGPPASSPPPPSAAPPAAAICAVRPSNWPANAPPWACTDWDTGTNPPRPKNRDSAVSRCRGDGAWCCW